MWNITTPGNVEQHGPHTLEHCGRQLGVYVSYDPVIYSLGIYLKILTHADQDTLTKMPDYENQKLETEIISITSRKNK